MPESKKKPRGKSVIPAASKLYWDACVFLSLIEGDPNRIHVLQAIIDDCVKGRREIFTSTLSITEVAFAKAEKDGRKLDVAVQRKINKLWDPSSPFKLVEVHRAIVLDAQSYVRNGMPSSIGIKPADAIHLASARKIGAVEFQTYDDFGGKARRIESLVGLTIRAPRFDGLVFTGPRP